MIDAFRRERAELLAEYVIDTGATVRAAAIHFGVSKSTVHKDLTYKLKYLNPILYRRVKAVLEINKSERHLRGGEATRQKYLCAAGPICICSATAKALPRLRIASSPTRIWTTFIPPNSVCVKKAFRTPLRPPSTCT